jgi:hypothetical protein
MADRHDWLSWQDYLSAHHGHMRRFEAFVVEDRYTPTGTLAP